MTQRKIRSREAYFREFGIEPDEDASGTKTRLNKEDRERLQVVLNNALDIRKFEIGLYWQRAAYFWAFIAVVFAGYFAAVDADVEPDILFLISCLGLIFSVGWYAVNRGSKFWQLNWEKHVDWLEDEIYGPLYKVVLDKESQNWWPFTGPFGFSVSRVNTHLSLAVVAAWIYLIIRSISKELKVLECFPGFNMVCAALGTVIFLVAILRTHKSHPEPLTVFAVREVRSEVSAGPKQQSAVKEA